MNLKLRGLTALARTHPTFWASKLHNPVFMIGCARSGTSILTKLLSLHADILNYSEANDVWDPEGYPWRFSRRETPPIWVDPGAFTERWWRETKPRGTEIAALFGAYQWLTRRDCFLNKSPLNTFRIPHLLEMFPEARFVHIVRDGRATVSSLAIKQNNKIQAWPAPFEAAGLDGAFEDLVSKLAVFWRTNLEEVARQDEQCRLTERNKLLEVTYEGLCEDKRAVLKAIASYLRLDMARFSPRVWQIELSNQNHKWRSQLDETVATQMLSLIGEPLAARGYR